MPKVKKTPNIDYCLEIFKKAAENITDETLKKEMFDAHDYVFASFSGEKQPNKGISCPPDKKIKIII